MWLIMQKQKINKKQNPKQSKTKQKLKMRVKMLPPPAQHPPAECLYITPQILEITLLYVFVQYEKVLIWSSLFKHILVMYKWYS